MRKFLAALVRFFAAVCAIVFVITLVLALILVNAENRLFKAETYKHALETTGMYERLPALVSQQIVAIQLPAHARTSRWGAYRKESRNCAPVWKTPWEQRPFLRSRITSARLLKLNRTRFRAALISSGRCPAPSRTCIGSAQLSEIPDAKTGNPDQHAVTPRQTRQMAEQTLDGFSTISMENPILWQSPSCR